MDILELRAEIDKARQENRAINLARANLVGLDLSGLDLSEAYLDYADLREASLFDTDLTRASLYQVVVQNTVGLVALEGVGSRNDTLYCWRKLGKNGRPVYMFKTGCFHGTKVQFERAVADKLRQEGLEYLSCAKAYRVAVKALILALDAQYECFYYFN